MTASEVDDTIARPTVAFRIGIGAIVTVIIQTVGVVIFLVQLRSDVNVLRDRNEDQDRAIAVLNTHAQRLIIVEERQNRVLESLRESAMAVRENATKLDNLQRTIDRWSPAPDPRGGPRLQSVDPPAR